MEAYNENIEQVKQARQLLLAAVPYQQCDPCDLGSKISEICNLLVDIIRVMDRED